MGIVADFSPWSSVVALFASGLLGFALIICLNCWDRHNMKRRDHSLMTLLVLLTYVIGIVLRLWRAPSLMTMETVGPRQRVRPPSFPAILMAQFVPAPYKAGKFLVPKSRHPSAKDARPVGVHRGHDH